MANPVSTATESNHQIVRNREKSNGAPPPPPNIALSSSLPSGQHVSVVRKDVPWNVTLQDIAAFIFQLLALTAALVFGAWAIKSYDAAQAANALSSESLSAAKAANQVGLLQVCYGSLLEYGSINSIACDYIMEALPIASVASAISISIPSSILTPATSSTTVAVSTPTSPTSPSAASSAAPSATNPTEVPSTISIITPLPSASSIEGSATATSTSPLASSAAPSVPQPFPTNTVGASPGSSNKSSLSLGAIIGIIVGSVFGLATVTVVIWLLRHRRPNQQPYLGSGFTPTSEAGLS